MGASTTVRVLVIIAIIVALIVALIYLVGRAKVRSNDRLKQLFNSETLDTLRIGVGVTAEEIKYNEEAQSIVELERADNTAAADKHVALGTIVVRYAATYDRFIVDPAHRQFLRSGEQHALLLNAYFVINDEPESALLADEMMERRPSTRAGANVILYGPSGTGKTAAARAVARSLGSTLAFVNAENLLSAYRLETKKKLRSLYRKMRALVCITGRNVLLLLDAVDGLVKNRSGAVTSGEYSLLTRFLTILEPNDGTDNYGVFSIFTTNRLSNLDDAFRRRCAAVFMGYVGYVGGHGAIVQRFSALTD
ncbi:suppressor protein of bem1/bed5 double mutants-like [Harpegnathos saltator]|uniref:suppressor protein of bem1/bed5 double mutants-like n=1 Tax=Harpegnathos saltator TaxID=610380 RepID=UPI000DBEE812|nr:suppressor protein of bem1/bed5 double mutants-like [Harpegnathos saltator]XP_025162227.1 suppressor protein of bem1/bed5 double mutants-like [Harpegnathos saltator]